MHSQSQHVASIQVLQYVDTWFFMKFILTLTTLQSFHVPPWQLQKYPLGYKYVLVVFHVSDWLMSNPLMYKVVLVYTH